MSGGHWEYLQYRFTEVIEDIKSVISKNGKEKAKEELREYPWRDEEWYKQNPEDRFHYKYPDEVISEFQRGLHYIQKAQVYMHRMDWLLSGDDGEDTFLEKLAEDLNKLKT